MAFLGGLPGILAAGTTAGLGTAEQQRARQDAIMRFGLNLAMEQQKLAELKRQHDLQGELVDITPQVKLLMPEYAGPPVKVARGQASGLYGAIASRQRPEPGVALGQLAENVGLELPPIQRTVPVQGPSETGPPSMSDVMPEVLGTAPIRDLAAEGARASRRYPTAAIGTLRDLFKERRERETAGQKTKDVASARAEMLLPNANLDSVLAKYPSLDAKDITGSTLAAPEKPPGLHFGPTGEIVQPTPGEGPGFKVLRPGQPDTVNDAIKAERLKALRAKNEMDALMQDVEKALAEGKQIPVAQATLYAQRATSVAAQFLRAMELTDNPEEKAMWKDASSEYLRFASKLKGKGGAAATGPAKPGESPADRVKRKWGIK